MSEAEDQIARYQEHIARLKAERFIGDLGLWIIFRAWCEAGDDWPKLQKILDEAKQAIAPVTYPKE